MQTTLRLNDDLYREAKAEAARCGMTITRFIEESLRDRLGQRNAGASQRERERQTEIEERNRLMEALLQRTAHFRIGPQPTRDEMNER